VKGALVEYVALVGTLQPVIIEQAIVGVAVPPCKDLPTEHELFKRFVARRSTGCEAIRQVEQDGLRQRRRGWRLFLCLPQRCERNAFAHRRVLSSLQRRNSEIAAQWPHKHTIHFLRGFALAGLDMSAPHVKSE
jgi:DNA-binding GntR family transcriptional regulator